MTLQQAEHACRLEIAHHCDRTLSSTRTGQKPLERLPRFVLRAESPYHLTVEN